MTTKAAEASPMVSPAYGSSVTKSMAAVSSARTGTPPVA